MSDSGSQVIDDILCIPMIIGEILQYFSDLELVDLSRVNKQFNFEARSMLRDRGTLAAKLEFDGSSQSPLEDLASDLEKMNVVPFSGIHILLSINETSTSAQIEPPNRLGPSYQVIRDRIPWRHFSVDFVDNWEGCKKYLPALALVNKIFMDLCGNIEELSLTFGGTLVKFLHNILQERSFPYLKILKIKTLSLEEWRLTRFLKMLVSNAANLQELHFDGCTFVEENVFLEGSSAVLVPTCGFNPLNQHISDSLMSSLRPTKIEIYQYGSDEDINLESLDAFIPTVLQACGARLNTLCMDLLFLVPLMCYGISLESVRRLQIGLRRASLEQIPSHILAILKSFDFLHVFPKLTEVEIVNNGKGPFSPDQISRFVDEENQGTWTNRPTNIKHLKLDDSISDWDSIAPFLTQMFPNLKTISVTTAHPSAFPYSFIWEHFLNLEELNVLNTEWRMPFIANLDSVVCGIFPEEVVELREKDEDYLKAVNIVPVMPAITCMRELRSFKLRYFVKRTDHPVDHNAAVMFSKVTGLIGFARCPALANIFQAARDTFEEVLSHMMPYANFTITNDFYRWHRYEQ